MSGASAAETRARVWLVDKPAGPTSHDVVARIRRQFPRRTKVGHTGTLDPFATGLMVVLSGRATRLAPLLSGLDKRYVAVVRTGFTSATGDPEGPLTVSGPPAEPAAIDDAVAGMAGRQTQRVPALAAVRVDGERLYARARRGEAVDTPEREIEVHDIRVVDHLGGGRAEIAVRCSAGTYIRQLAADIGARAGAGGYCESLRRTHVGDLSVDDALPPDRVIAGGGCDPLDALGHLPRREVDEGERVELSHGRPVAGAEDGPVLLAHDGRLVAVAHGDGAGHIRPRIVLAPAGAG